MEDEEVGAIVVAENEDICEQALKLIEVDWEVLPHILDPRDGMKADAPILRANMKGKGNVALTHYAQGTSKQDSEMRIRLLNSIGQQLYLHLTCPTQTVELHGV